MTKKRRQPADETIAVRAVRTRQGGVDLFAFFAPGAELLKFAEISRVSRNESAGLSGFQRKEIKGHVRSIVEFLDRGDVLFPNAIILAMSPAARFTEARGTKPEGDLGASQGGTLRIPLPTDGSKAAWIVDGQQRSLALAGARDQRLPVPVIAFVSDDIAVHREQFILVNKARPLPSRLIDELLPEVGSVLPRDLAPRKIPSELVNSLHVIHDSPFHGLIKRLSDDRNGAVVNDAAVLTMIKNSIGSPLGALAPYKATASGGADTAAMYAVLVAFWSAVREVFPDAWGRPPTESRLMHSAGIVAMGYLMDRIMSRCSRHDARQFAVDALTPIAPHCRWTSGRWNDIGREWNDIQYAGRDVRMLSDQLARLDHLNSFGKKAA
ncbi:DGQHR domain-containing protein DpdB [Sphingomonas phyllosphaerae]|uniref:DGQHR domain-containing protein DpdB n=1 Tax=Sphingomonas phyllosphaerae TaxID=257003 RepID=UPI0003B5CD2B|nr:DGQHR domain-containing protein DpdB [Sphingomonas phyllosphaerae]